MFGLWINYYICSMAYIISGSELEKMIEKEILYIKGVQKRKVIFEKYSRASYISNLADSILNKAMEEIEKQKKRK